jgi:hypothetical protein
VAEAIMAEEVASGVAALQEVSVAALFQEVVFAGAAALAVVRLEE